MTVKTMKTKNSAMDKFWNWMFSKEYCVDAYGGTGVERKGAGAYIPGSGMANFTNQMIIGYMSEFLLEHKYLPEVIIDKSIDITVKELIADIVLFTSVKDNED